LGKGSKKGVICETYNSCGKVKELNEGCRPIIIKDPAKRGNCHGLREGREFSPKYLRNPYF